MIADNFGIKILQVSALAPKDFSQSYLPLSNVCPRHSLTSCVLGNDTGSNTWTPVNDTIDFILRVRSSLLRLSAMTESSFGSLRSTTNAAGTDISASPVVRSSFTYTGREYEDETGMFYYRARYYSPTTGRFLQSDPDPGSLGDPKTFNSRYIYALNNPIKFRDATGTSALGDFLVGIVAFVAAFFLSPLIAAAALGGATAGLAFYATSAIAGALIGSIVGGLANVASHNGSFDDGAKIGAMAGFFGGLAGAAYFGNDMAWRIEQTSNFSKGRQVADVGWARGGSSVPWYKEFPYTDAGKFISSQVEYYTSGEGLVGTLGCTAFAATNTTLLVVGTEGVSAAAAGGVYKGLSVGCEAFMQSGH